MSDGPAAAESARKSAAPVRSAGVLRSLIGRLTLRSRLLLMLIPTSLLSMGTVAYLGYTSGKNALTQLATDQIVAVRSAKKQQIETHFRTARDTFAVFGENVAVVSAMSQFKDGFARMGRTRLAEDRRRRLEAVYRDSVLPELQKRSIGDMVLFESVFPRTDRAIEAQALFIAENPTPAERAKLIDHPVSNPYTLAHFTYHPWFRDLAERLNFHDLMLVDADNGDIVYSVAKEIDFGTSLIDGPHANANVGRLFRQVLAEHRKGYVRFVDFERYTPSNGMPSMFIAAPIYANFKLVGILVGQMSDAPLNRATNGDKSWAQDGLGRTGLAYIAGPAMDLRTEHRAFLEDPNRFLADLRAVGVPEAALKAAQATRTTVLALSADVEGVRRGLRGETGTVSARNLSGRPALQAYAPLAIPDMRWTLLTQIDEAEILAPQARFQRNMMILACTLALLTTLAGMWLASRFLRPVSDLIGAVDRLRRGEAVQLDSDGDDEFARLSADFNAMSASIADRDRIIADKSKAHEALLKRMFPEAIADRLKAGEVEIVEQVPNVTLVFASVLGFVPAIQKMTPQQSMQLLSDLFDAADQLATQHGVDRIKTFGEHYIAAVGLSATRLDHAQRAVAFADALAVELNRMAGEKRLPVRLRVALASGDVVAGLIGSNRFVYDVWGPPLNVVRRLVHEASEGQLRIATSTRDLLTAPEEFIEQPPVDTHSMGRVTSYARPLRSAPGRNELPAAAE